MNGTSSRHHVSQAAAHYGTVSDLRAQAAKAIVDGDYSVAISISTQALRLSHDALSQLDLSAPSVRPHQALAGAVLCDLNAARAAAIEPVGLPPGIFALEAQVRELADFGTRGIKPTATPRKCPHGRPSYDGNCMSVPPCPAS